MCTPLSSLSSEINLFLPVYFHGLQSNAPRAFRVILSSIDLLTLPISLFAGLNNLQSNFVAKFSLWSFSVMYASLLAIVSILSATFRV